MIELIYDAAVKSAFKTPVNGKRTSGIMAVAASGIASVIHHDAIKNAIEAITAI